MPPDPNVHVGVCAWVEKDDKVLMLLRAGKGEFASDGYGTWSLPGGWLEMGEEPWDTAVRETHEETSVVVSPVKELGFVHCPSYDGKFQIVTLIYRCLYRMGEPTVTEPDKADAVTWMPKTSIGGLELFAPLAQYLQKEENALG